MFAAGVNRLATNPGQTPYHLSITFLYSDPERLCK